MFLGYHNRERFHCILIYNSGYDYEGEVSSSNIYHDHQDNIRAGTTYTASPTCERSSTSYINPMSSSIPLNTSSKEKKEKGW